MRGRDPDVDLTLDDPGVSRRHASLRAEGQTAIVTDLDSSNGTFVNGEPVTTPLRLRGGDRVQIGASTLEIDTGTTETEMIDSPTPTEVGAPPPVPARPPGPAEPAPARSEPPPPRREPIPYPDERTAGPAQPRQQEPAGGASGGFSWPAVAAALLGPLSILLLLLGSGAAFYAALPFGIIAIALATVGKRQAHSGAGMRGVAVLGQVTGLIGTILAALVILVLIAVSAATDVAADNLPDLIDEVEDEIRGQVESNAP